MKGCSRTSVIKNPCNQPSPMAITITALTAHTLPHRHSVSIMESNTPRSAKTEPTERSIPPVIMTIPSPMLKMP